MSKELGIEVIYYKVDTNKLGKIIRKDTEILRKIIPNLKQNGDVVVFEVNNPNSFRSIFNKVLKHEFCQIYKNMVFSISIFLDGDYRLIRQTDTTPHKVAIVCLGYKTVSHKDLETRLTNLENWRK